MRKLKWRTEKGVHNRKVIVENKRNFITNLKAQVGCAECGIHNPVILLLHHVEPKIQKTGSRQPRGFNWISNSWMKIRRELKKCTVLCLNHHGLEHEGIRGKNTPPPIPEELIGESYEQLQLL